MAVDLVLVSLAVLIGALVVATVAWLLLGVRALVVWRRRRWPVFVWQPTGVRRTTEPGYDQAKAVAGARAARRHSPTGRPYLVRHTRRPKT